ncbi:MAG: hypothetical protein KIT22_13175 [Verrucomicrobiae bacterium]|nr:hypothetical protein [Verrucomicrobiae bacterium]
MKRFLTIFGGVFVILLITRLLRGRTLAEAAVYSAIWSAVSTGIFLATQFYRSRKGQHCELCRDTPEMHEDARSEMKDGKRVP